MKPQKKHFSTDFLKRSYSESVFFNEPQFRMLLVRERKRSERTKAPFLFVAATVNTSTGGNTARERAMEKLQECLTISSREIDVRGWYRENEEAGVIFTDVKKEAVDYILEKLNENIKSVFGEESAQHISLRYALFPLEDGKNWIASQNDSDMIFPDHLENSSASLLQNGLKRALDTGASFVAIVMLLPLFAVVAALIKATSKGPVFFKQQRIGLGGKPFTMYKFRSMKTDCDPAIHKTYVEQLIKGGAGVGNGENKVFKIKNDPRLTPVGALLRKTSIDELPQLFNVLTGEMSLVGPRPPITYEVEAYDVWHRRRLFNVRPGITGLWQVEGRSRTTFDDMVRMDIRYSQEWSLWLDIKLIMKTPAAVVGGKGAY
jgi:exopolysaccharide biosynthesis polyprenyl glycosylphosphotransferase